MRILRLNGAAYFVRPTAKPNVFLCGHNPQCIAVADTSVTYANYSVGDLYCLDHARELRARLGPAVVISAFVAPTPRVHRR